MTKNINKIWVEAIPLSDYIYDLYGEEIDAEIDEYQNNHINPINLANDKSGLHSLAYAIHSFVPNKIKSNNVKDAFQKEIRPKLIVDELRLIGLREVDYHEPPLIIPPDFWFRAQINTSCDSATSGDTTFKELKIIQEPEFLPLKAKTAQRLNSISDNSISSPEVKTKSDGGRPKSREKVVKKLDELLKTNDQVFGQLTNRTEQAREIRVRLEGEDSRYKDNFPELSTNSIKRWIGTKLKTS